MVAAFAFGMASPLPEPTPAMTEDYLLVKNEDPVEFDAYIDPLGKLQLSHDTDLLIDCSDTVHATHDTNPTITVRIYDFSQGGSTWEIDASHTVTTGPIEWARGANFAYYEFSDTGGEIDVDIEASDGSTTKEKKVKIYIKPSGGL